MLAHLLLLSSALAEELTVSSNIRGLSIVVNGVDTGLKTPATVDGVAPGNVMVQVGDACRAGSAMAEVTAGQGGRVNVRAEEQLATLTVAVTPAQAVVDVNGGKVTLSPNVPVGLPCGTYEVVAQLKGYSPVSYSLELIGGQTLELPIELERLGVSSVELSVRPSAGTILFDGVEVGQDAAVMPTVYEGLHTISASAKGYNDLSQPIWVDGGNNLVFKLELGRGDEKGSVTAVGGAGRSALEEGKRRAGASVDDEETEETGKREEVADLPPEEVDEPEEEPDEELAPVKSWSEKAAEKAAKDSASAKKEKAVDLDAVEPAKPSKKGLRIGGGVLLGLGAVVAGGGGYFTYAQAAESYTIAQAKYAAADAATGDQAVRLTEVADDYYYNEFGPKNNVMIGVIGAGGVVAGAGLLLLVIDGDATPFVAPAPGGGMVGWSSSF
jgi:hypothetical protein